MVFHVSAAGAGARDISRGFEPRIERCV